MGGIFTLRVKGTHPKYSWHHSESRSRGSEICYSWTSVLSLFQLELNWTTELISLTGLKPVDREACGWRECYFNWLACGEIELSIWYQHPLIKTSLPMFTESWIFVKFAKIQSRESLPLFSPSSPSHFWLPPKAKDPLGIAENQLRGGMLSWAHV